MVFSLDPQNATSLLSPCLTHCPPPTCGLWVLPLMASNLRGSHSLLGRSSVALEWKQRYKMRSSLKAWWAEELQGQWGKRGRGAPAEHLWGLGPSTPAVLFIWAACSLHVTAAILPSLLLCNTFWARHLLTLFFFHFFHFFLFLLQREKCSLRKIWKKGLTEKLRKKPSGCFSFK